MDAHDMAPDEVLALVPALGGTLGRVVVVGCEIASVEPATELSAACSACIPAAVAAVLDVVTPTTVPEPSRDRRSMMKKLMLLVLVAGGAFVAVNLPDIKRYLKMRAM